MNTQDYLFLDILRLRLTIETIDDTIKFIKELPEGNPGLIGALREKKEWLVKISKDIELLADKDFN